MKQFVMAKLPHRFPLWEELLGDADLAVLDLPVRGLVSLLALKEVEQISD